MAGRRSRQRPNFPLDVHIGRVLAIATSTTNVIGNSIAVFVICRWENLFDRERFDAFLNPVDSTAPATGLALEETTE